MLPLEQLEINNFKIELFPIYAYDVLTNLPLFNKVMNGNAEKEDMEKYLRLIFSNCKAFSINGEEIKLINDRTFKEVFDVHSKELQESINTILKNSMPDGNK